MFAHFKKPFGGPPNGEGGPRALPRNYRNTLCAKSVFSRNLAATCSYEFSLARFALSSQFSQFLHYSGGSE
jgi:hypothetical protein